MNIVMREKEMLSLIEANTKKKKNEEEKEKENIRTRDVFFSLPRLGDIGDDDNDENIRYYVINLFSTKTKQNKNRTILLQLKSVLVDRFSFSLLIMLYTLHNVENLLHHNEHVANRDREYQLMVD